MLIVNTDVLLTNWRVQIVALAAHYALPTIYPVREFATVGGLMSYGPDLIDTTARRSYLFTSMKWNWPVSLS